MSCCPAETKTCCPKSDAQTTGPGSTVSDYYASLAKVERARPSCNPNSCTLTKAQNEAVRKAERNLHDELQTASLGCGSPFPPCLEGCRVLDLGSGRGRDCYIMSQLVGKSGSVVGVDMTDEMLKKSTQLLDYHAEKFGYANVKFVKSRLETLLECSELEQGSFDVITSNCVLNLCPSKAEVFAAVAKLLKPGGEFYFSDVYSDKPVSEAAKQNDFAWNECFSGALAWGDFKKAVADASMSGPFVTSTSPYEAWNEELQEVLGDVRFYSHTVRLINTPNTGEKSDVTLTYDGGMADCAKEFVLAQDYAFKATEGKVVAEHVAAAVQTSRYAKYFEVTTVL